MKAVYKLFLLVLVMPPAVLNAQDQSRLDTEREARVKEIEEYETIAGTWEGYFFITSAPGELLAAHADDGTKDEVPRIRIELSDKEYPKVYLRYAHDDDWYLLSGRALFSPNAVGWHIHIDYGEGVWIQKYSITFDRVKEREAAITLTRTVHNWFIPEPEPGIVDFYHMFGVGKVTKLDAETSVEQ